MPSSNQMIALLGLLAVAGYQNRDKLGEMLGKLSGTGSGAAVQPPAGSTAAPSAAPSSSSSPTQAGTGGVLGQLGGIFGGGAAASGDGGGIGGVLGELVNKFSGAGHGEAVKSWVETGPNGTVSAGQIEAALGPDAIDALTNKTGLSRDDLLARLQSVLPQAIDKMTPDGRLPSQAESAAMMSRLQI